MSEEKKKKKKLIKVEGYNTTYAQRPQSISFSLVSKTDKGRKQALKFLSCRDHLNDALYAKVHNTSSSVYTPGHDPTIDLDKLRLLIGRYFNRGENREKFVENIFSAKRLLNFYEEVAGWNKSKITTVNHSILKYDAWLITGPKEWLSYPNLMSIITLTFRIIANHGPIEFSNNRDIEKWFYTLTEKYDEERSTSVVFQYDTDLSNYLPKCWDKLYMLMKHHKEIFTQPIEKAYTRDIHIHAYGGIIQLCKFNTMNKVLDENVRRTYDKFKREKYRTMEDDGTTYKLHSEFVEHKKLEDEQNRIKFGVNSSL